jgi:hypothetical protein
LRGLDEVIVLGKKVTRVPLAASVLCYAVGGQTFFVADGSGAVPMPLPPPTLPGEAFAEPFAEPFVTKSRPTPTPAAVDHEERSAEVLNGDLWRAFIRKHQPPWMTELPPDEEAAFATWVEALPDEATRNRGFGSGWHWNESKSSRDGAFLGPDSITWFTDSLTSNQGSSGCDEAFKSFLEGGPNCHRDRPPGVLVEILVAVWHRKYLDLSRST